MNKDLRRPRRLVNIWSRRYAPSRFVRSPKVFFALSFLAFLLLSIIQFYEKWRIDDVLVLDHSPSFPGNTHYTRVSFVMDDEMADAWLTSSKRLNFSIQLSVERIAAHSSSKPEDLFASPPASISKKTSTVLATFYGKSSLKLKYTKRRSLHIQSSTPFHFLSPRNTKAAERFGTNTSILLKEFFLLSLWEDKHRISYRTAVDLLQQLDLLFSYAQLVELRCYPPSHSARPGHLCAPLHTDRSVSDGMREGKTLGVYLVIEPPSQAIWRRISNAFHAFSMMRAKAVEEKSTSAIDASGALHRRIYETNEEYVTRMNSWRYMWREVEEAYGGDVKAGIETASRYTEISRKVKHILLHVPSYMKNSSFTPAYELLERNPLLYSFVGNGTGIVDGGSKRKGFADMPQYMAWIAINTLLENGDYDDEVLFFGMMPRNGKSPTSSTETQLPIHIGMMGWDYDMIFSLCHRNVQLKTPFMYCAETLLDHYIVNTPSLMKRYKEILVDLLGYVDAKRFYSSVQVANDELLTILQWAPGAMRATFGTDMHRKETGVQWIMERFRNSWKRLTHASLLHLAGDKGLKNAENATERAGVIPGDMLPTNASKEVTFELLGYISKLITVKHSLVVIGSAAAAEGLAIREVQSAIGHRVADTGRYRLPSPGMYCAKMHIPKSTLQGFGLVEKLAALGQWEESMNSMLIDVPLVLPCQTRGSAEYGLQRFEKLHPMQEFMGMPPPPPPSGDEVTSLLIIVPPVWPRADNRRSDGVFVARVLHSQQRRGIDSSLFRWTRKNRPLSTADAVPLTTLILRGFSAIRFRETPDNSSDASNLFKHHREMNMKNGPLLFVRSDRNPTELLIPGTSVRQMASLASVLSPPPVTVQPSETGGKMRQKGLVDAKGVAFGKLLKQGSTLTCVSEGASATTAYTAKCPIFIHDTFKIDREATLEVTAGCVVVLLPASLLYVGGALRLSGSPGSPVVFTSKDASKDSSWQTVHVDGEAASLHANFTFFTHSGVKGRRVPKTGKHHSHSAAISATSGSLVSLRHCFLLELKGPAIAAGTQAVVHVADSLVQWAHMGIECVHCFFTSERSVWSNFPSWDIMYECMDNDAMYLSGGKHRVKDSVIAHTKDDGIDSGGDDGSLLVHNTIIEGCMHEGVALSSSAKSSRDVVIAHTVIQYCQQGVESGYASVKHIATVTSSLIQHCGVGVRFGDNYIWSHCDGTLIVHNTTLAHNQLNAMNYERCRAAPKGYNHFHSQSNMLEHHRDLLNSINNSFFPRVQIPSSGSTLRVYADERAATLKESWKGCTDVFSLPGSDDDITVPATKESNFSLEVVEEEGGYLSDLFLPL